MVSLIVSKLQFSVRKLVQQTHKSRGGKLARRVYVLAKKKFELTPQTTNWVRWPKKMLNCKALMVMPKTYPPPPATDIRYKTWPQKSDGRLTKLRHCHVFYHDSIYTGTLGLRPNISPAVSDFTKHLHGPNRRNQTHNLTVCREKPQSSSRQ
jgi:hypothetical protein